MKTLIQKDLRENLKVALIGFAIFSLMLLGAYLSGIASLNALLAGNRYQQATNALQPLLAPLLLQEAAFFCAIFGAALGWLQTRNEAHRDLWAFLIHRPVTRTEIFWGKSIAGLCLYFLGAGLPLVVLVLVARTPGHVAAPFEWAMVLPLFSFVLSGVAFYFAGMLTGLRQARWYGSRGFGLGLALAASFGALSVYEFWQYSILFAIVVVALAAAVWGCYETGGFYRGQPVIGRLATILAMAAGSGGVLFVVVGLLFVLVVNPLTQHPSVYSNYQMTREGVVYKVTSRDNVITEIVDLDGHPLLDPKTGRTMERQEFQKHFSYGGSVSSRFQGNQIRYGSGLGGNFFNLVQVTDKTLWYLDRHGKLTGYDGRTRRYIGSLDPHGLGGTSMSGPFLTQPYYYYNPYDETSPKTLATAKAVYQADFKARALKPIFAVTNDDEIGGCMALRGMYGGGLEEIMLVTTRKSIFVLDSDGHSMFKLPYQPGYSEYPQVAINRLDLMSGSTNSFAVWFYPDFQANQKMDWKLPLHVLWLSSEGAVSKSADLPVLRGPDFTPWPDKAVTALLPTAAHVTFDRKIYEPWNLLGLALGVVCAVIGWRLARRHNYSTGACFGWTVFIFLLGVVGLLAFLCVQEWAAREECPHCKKLRAVDREACEHCNSPFSPPEKNGTEIFGPLAKA
jgi:hypothetical protein